LANLFADLRFYCTQLVDDGFVARLHCIEWYICTTLFDQLLKYSQ